MNTFSKENLEKGIKISRNQKNQFGKPFALGKDNVYKITCPECKEKLQFPSMLPKLICYKCNEVIDNLLKYEDIKKIKIVL